MALRRHTCTYIGLRASTGLWLPYFAPEYVDHNGYQDFHRSYIGSGGGGEANPGPSTCDETVWASCRSSKITFRWAFSSTGESYVIRTSDVRTNGSDRFTPSVLPRVKSRSHTMTGHTNTPRS
jgi:hypothetical protein